MAKRDRRQNSARTATTSPPPPNRPADPRSGLANAVFGSPFLWGGLLTVGFYALIPYLPIQKEMAVRYFCSHPLEYATALLFFIGLAILGRKLISVGGERSALEMGLLDGPQLTESAHPHDRADVLEARLASLPPAVERTCFVQRVQDVVAYLRGRNSTAGLEEHLRYLAELASERLHGSYALVRTITWAVPILGFLGTVIGITMAIANVTPEQLDTSLSSVTSGLAVAFDTTALSLALSIVLVFGAFLVERAEQNVLASVEEIGIQRILCLFPPENESHDPLMDAQAEAAQQLLQRTEELINWQAELWQNSLSALRERWAKTLETQQQAFESSLQHGMAATLENHSQQLADLRAEFLQAIQQVTRGLSENQQTALDRQQQQQAAWDAHSQKFWQQWQQLATALQADQGAQLQRLVDSLSTGIANWQQQLADATSQSATQLQALQQQAEQLAQLAGREDQLAELQQRLTENLDAVRASETFEQTLHSLNAAVHLMTARFSNRAA